MIASVGAQRLSGRSEAPVWSLHEVLPRDQLRTLQEQRLREQVAYVWEHNSWYREKWRRAGLSPDQVRTLDDVRRIPFLTKEEIRSSQAERPPFGLMLCDCIDPSRLVRLAMTSGTTGDPVLIPFTAEDYYVNWLEGVVRTLWACGVRQGDKVHAAFGFTPYIGLAGAYDACEHLIGAMVVPGGSWDTRLRLGMLRRLKVDVLMGTPTYLLHMGRVAQREGLDPRDLKIRLIFTTGEPGIVSAPNTGKRLQELWGCRQVGEFSGTQETEYFHWTCQHGAGHLNDDQVLFEVLDPATQEPVPPGDEGLLVVTDLVQKTHPLMRFPTGDVVRGIVPSDCPCGRTLSVFKGFAGRVGDIVKIRGVGISVSGVENVVRSNPQLSDNYEIVATTPADGELDEVTVRVEPAPALPPAAWPALKERVALDLKNHFFINIAVELVEPGKLPTYELKAKRFFDRRRRLD